MSKDLRKDAQKCCENYVSCIKLWVISSSFCLPPKAKGKLSPWVLLRAVYTMLSGVNTINRAFMTCQFSKCKSCQPEETRKKTE